MESTASAARLFCFNSSNLMKKNPLEYPYLPYKGNQPGRIKTPRLQMTIWDEMLNTLT